MIFYLGTHEPSWLAWVKVPLFLSRRRLRRRKYLPRACGPWALDSGGFTELGREGRWSITARQYASEVRFWRERIGNLRMVFPMDWMCEPSILRMTGLTVAEHQQRTLDNYLELLALAPEIPWVPVLQGWHFEDYIAHLEQYSAAGVQLHKLPLVGLGSVCRRQATDMAEDLVRDLCERGITIHGFGFKTRGVLRLPHELHSADSLAWSLNARKNPPLPGCPHQHCNNCLRFALRWRERLLEKLNQAQRRSHQRLLF